MRYTIEATENSCTEIFELRNGKKYIRKHLEIMPTIPGKLPVITLTIWTITASLL